MARDISDYETKYLQDYDFEKVLVEFRREKVLEVLNKYKPQSILEIGCGDDSIFNYYNSFNEFVAVEPGQLFAEKAKKDALKLGGGRTIKIIKDFFEDSIEKLLEYNFDFIILSGLLHEVENPNLFLEDVIKVLNNNAILHINVPNSKSFHLLWAYESGLINELGGLTDRAKSLQQHTTFDLKFLETMVKEKGLEVVDKGSYFVKPFNHSKMAECIKAGLIDKSLLNGLDKMVRYMPDLGAEIFVNCKKV